MDCHNAQNFQGECTAKAKTDQMQCTKALAKNYIHYTNAPDCVKMYSNRYLFPEVNEVEEWCTPDRKSTLLGINSSMLKSIAMTAMFVTFAVLYSI